MSTSPRPGWWYRLTIPWFWLIVALLSWKHPGDEYGLFVIANGLPGAWFSLWFPVTGSPNEIFPVMLAISGVSMFLLCWAMDRLRVPWWPVLTLWLIGAKILFDMSYGHYESHARAIAKNGSMTAYVTASSNLSLCLTCLACIVIIGLYRAAQMIVARLRPQPESMPLAS